MSGDDTSYARSYAPTSPNLIAAFYSTGPTPPAPLALSAHSATAAQLDDKNHQHPKYKSEPQADVPPPVHLHYQPHQPQPQPHSQPHLPEPRTLHSEYYPAYSQPAQPQYLSPIPDQKLPPLDYALQQPVYQQQRYGQPYGDQPEYGASTYPQHYTSPFGTSASSSNPKSEPGIADMPPRRAPPPPPPVIEPSPVKTKFPTARIKRIMQADEEVGKVAQQTPIAVGKALEMFMIQMVSKSAEVAKEKGSKRVTASMLKQVVETDDQWDFLREIVGRVENEKEGSKSKAKVESSSDEEMVEPKKTPRRGGRKKKNT
ncbi:Fc.00g076960.m01.CDS01 [Cosmosporella sp. VM-42]